MTADRREEVMLYVCENGHPLEVDNDACPESCSSCRSNVALHVTITVPHSEIAAAIERDYGSRAGGQA